MYMLGSEKVHVPTFVLSHKFVPELPRGTQLWFNHYPFGTPVIEMAALLALPT